MTTHISKLLSLTACLTGAAVAASLLSGLHVRGGAQSPGATVSLSVAWSNDLNINRTGQVARRVMTPDTKPLAAHLAVRNATGGSLAVRLQAGAPDGALDRSLFMRVSRSGVVLFQGTLGELRRGSQSFVLASHRGATLVITSKIVGPSNAYRGRLAPVTLSFVSRKAA